MLHCRNSKISDREFIPHTILRDHVKRFWILEKEYTAEDSVEEVTPDACVELILNFGSPHCLPRATPGVTPMTRLKVRLKAASDV